MEPIRISPYTLILFGTIAGLLFGLIPLILGIRKKRSTLGVIGLICSIIGGAISGIFLIIPVIAVFIYLILKKSPTTESAEVGTVNENPIDVEIDK
ncbi:MAG TPA: hypothetical protein VNI84_21615 [Pyrinomonadaceae bacterium]|nr:hypothetical protein [Pyrinomonadaceae bacterium]